MKSQVFNRGATDSLPRRPTVGEIKQALTEGDLAQVFAPRLGALEPERQDSFL